MEYYDADDFTTEEEEIPLLRNYYGSNDEIDDEIGLPEISGKDVKACNKAFEMAKQTSIKVVQPTPLKTSQSTSIKKVDKK
jgi:hypothetical protein